jgi:hypothetical protein
MVFRTSRWGQYTCSAHLWQWVASRLQRDGMLCWRVTPCSLCYVMPVFKYFVLALRKVVRWQNRSDSAGGSQWTCARREVCYGTCMPSHASSLYGECVGDISCSNFGRNVRDLDSFPTSSRPLAKCRCSIDVFHIVSDFLSSDLLLRFCTLGLPIASLNKHHETTCNHRTVNNSPSTDLFCR